MGAFTRTLSCGSGSAFHETPTLKRFGRSIYYIVAAGKHLGEALLKQPKHELHLFVVPDRVCNVLLNGRRQFLGEEVRRKAPPRGTGTPGLSPRVDWCPLKRRKEPGLGPGQIERRVGFGLGDWGLVYLKSCPLKVAMNSVVLYNWLE